MSTAAKYIWERRLADPSWVRRWKRSLGANRNQRWARGTRLERAKEETKALFEAAEAQQQARNVKAKTHYPKLWEKAKTFFQSLRKRGG